MTSTKAPDGHPARLLHPRSGRTMTADQLKHRQSVLDRIDRVDEDTWIWTGQAKSAKGQKYPQIAHSLGDGATQLVNARHVVYYLSSEWVPRNVQRYRAMDGNPLNVHPNNLAPMPPVVRARQVNRFWDTTRLRKYYG